MKRLMMLITAIAVMFGGMAFVATAANADEPVVDISDFVAGSAEFEIDAKSASEASLKTKTGVKIYLNVQAKPMKPRQIKAGTCRTAPVGKHFFNEMVDPATGGHYFKPWVVQAGDNVFCMDNHGVWRKKSCGNAAKGIFGVPKPPKSKIRVKGEVRDYLKYKGKVAGKGKIQGSATAHVVQYDEGKQVCEAKAAINGTASAMYMASVMVRSRTVVAFEAEAVTQAQVNLSSDTSVKGDLEGRLRLSLEGQAMAWCNYTPPPPAHDECTNIPGDQPEGYECYPPPTANKPVIVDMSRVNDLNVNWKATICAKADFDLTHSGKLLFSFSSGAIEGTNPVQVTDLQEGCVTLVAPSDPGTYTYKVTAIDGVTNLSTTATSQPFTVNPEPGIPG